MPVKLYLPFYILKWILTLSLCILCPFVVNGQSSTSPDESEGLRALSKAINIHQASEAELMKASPDIINNLPKVLQDEASSQRVKSGGLIDPFRNQFYHTVKVLPMEVFKFYTGIGVLVTIKLFSEFAMNPIGMLEHIENQLSPVGVLGLSCFLFTQGITIEYLSKIIKRNSSFTPLIPTLGMVAGFFAQDVFNSFAQDPNLKACVIVSVGLVREHKVLGADNEKPCSTFFSSYVLLRKARELTPSLASLLAVFGTMSLLQKEYSKILGSIAKNSGVQNGGQFVKKLSKLELIGIEISIVGKTLANNPRIIGSLAFFNPTARAISSIGNILVNITLMTALDQEFFHKIFEYIGINFFDSRSIEKSMNSMTQALVGLHNINWNEPLVKDSCGLLQKQTDCTKDFSFYLFDYSERMNAWRASHLNAFMHAHEQWKKFLMQFQQMYFATFDIQTALVNEINLHKLKQPNMLLDKDELFGVNPNISFAHRKASPDFYKFSQLLTLGKFYNYFPLYLITGPLTNDGNRLYFASDVNVCKAVYLSIQERESCIIILQNLKHINDALLDVKNFNMNDLNLKYEITKARFDQKLIVDSNNLPDSEKQLRLAKAQNKLDQAINEYNNKVEKRARVFEKLKPFASAALGEVHKVISSVNMDYSRLRYLIDKVVLPSNPSEVSETGYFYKPFAEFKPHNDLEGSTFIYSIHNFLLDPNINKSLPYKEVQGRFKIQNFTESVLFNSICNDRSDISDKFKYVSLYRGFPASFEIPKITLNQFDFTEFCSVRSYTAPSNLLYSFPFYPTDFPSKSTYSKGSSGFYALDNDRNSSFDKDSIFRPNNSFKGTAVGILYHYLNNSFNSAFFDEDPLQKESFKTPELFTHWWSENVEKEVDEASQIFQQKYLEVSTKLHQAFFSNNQARSVTGNPGVKSWLSSPTVPLTNTLSHTFIQQTHFYILVLSELLNSIDFKTKERASTHPPYELEIPKDKPLFDVLLNYPLYSLSQLDRYYTSDTLTLTLNKLSLQKRKGLQALAPKLPPVGYLELETIRKSVEYYIYMMKSFKTDKEQNFRSTIEYKVYFKILDQLTSSINQSIVNLMKIFRLHEDCFALLGRGVKLESIIDYKPNSNQNSKPIDQNLYTPTVAIDSLSTAKEPLASHKVIALNTLMKVQDITNSLDSLARMFRLADYKDKQAVLSLMEEQKNKPKENVTRGTQNR